MKCWEFMKCGREENGFNVDKLGVCPAYPDNGENCYSVVGTFCSGEVQGTHAQHLKNCMRCKFFQKIHSPRLMTAASKQEKTGSEIN